MENRSNPDLGSLDLETLKGRIVKIIKKFNVKDCDEATNILRRQYPLYNKKKRKFIKKIVNDVLLNPPDPINSSVNDSDSICVDEQHSDHSTDLTVGQQMSTFYSASNSDNETNECEKNTNQTNSGKDAAFDCVEIESDEDIGRKRRAPDDSSINEENRIARKRFCPNNIFANFGNIESLTFKDVYGMEKVLENIKEITKTINLYHQAKETYPTLSPIEYFLLCGMSGSGKSYIARAIAGEYDFDFCEINCAAILRKGSLSAERKLNDILCLLDGKNDYVVLFDNLDCLTNDVSSPNINAIESMVELLCMFIDSQKKKSNMLIIGAVKNTVLLHPSLLRADRFSETIFLTTPTFTERVSIFKTFAKELKTKINVDFQLLAEKTPGFQFIDLKKLFNKAYINVHYQHMFSNRNSTEENGDINNFCGQQKSDPKNLVIEFNDFRKPLKKLKPKQETNVSIPEITWDNIGSLSKVKSRINSSIFAYLKDPIRAELFKVKRPPGILFFGPPGCGKTLIAKAIANEGGLNFISVKGGEFFNMYVGESEKSVRLCFEKARLLAPSMIFFDEIDGLCSQRSESASTPVIQRVVTQLLSEMDGIIDRGDVYLLAATNQPDKLDPALLRPGRFGDIIYVGLPDAQGRYEILKAITTDGPPLDSDVDLKEISELKECENFTGADLQNLIDKAICVSFARQDSIAVKKSDILQAFELAQPSVSDERLEYYLKMKQRFKIFN